MASGQAADLIGQIGAMIMSTKTDVSPLGTAASLEEAKAGAGRAAKALAARAAAWIDACADFYAAAAAYEQLSRLCDAELRRRGLSRATLASDIAQACDRTRAE
jgi:hypothetical protein